MIPRVLLLSSYYHPVVGGAESNARRFAGYLQAHSIPVTVLTKRITRDLPDEERIDGVPIARIGPYGQRSAAGKWWLVPAASVALIGRRDRYDVVCCIDVRAAGVAAIAARAVTGRPVVVQAQTPGVMSGGSPLKAPVRALYRHADAYACISHAVEREALEAGVPPDRVHHVPNAIDMTLYRLPTEGERSAIREELGVAHASVVCLFVGRLSREKGVMELMEAWRLVQQHAAVPATLLIAGPDMDGHPWNVGPAARAFAEANGFRESVRFLGSRTDVPRVLAAADIAVQPSHFEALGLSAVEALATGVPVVASAVGGLLDFIADDINGKLCPPENPTALAQALRAVIDDGELRRRLAMRARPSVQTEYDEQIVFGRFVELLRHVAEAAA